MAATRPGRAFFATRDGIGISQDVAHHPARRHSRREFFRPRARGSQTALITPAMRGS